MNEEIRKQCQEWKDSAYAAWKEYDEGNSRTAQCLWLNVIADVLIALAEHILTADAAKN